MDGVSYGVCDTNANQPSPNASIFLFAVSELSDTAHKAELRTLDNKPVALDFFKAVGK